MAGAGPPSTPLSRPAPQGVDSGPAPGHECVREDALSARCKSAPGLVAAQKSKVTASPRLDRKRRSNGWRATGGELAVRRMTNLFRRGLVASLLMDGEAWNNLWR